MKEQRREIDQRRHRQWILSHFGSEAQTDFVFDLGVETRSDPSQLQEKSPAISRRTDTEDDQGGEAVITVEIAARAADSAFAPSLFPAPLPEGTEVRVLENRAPWMRVRLANRRDVWIKESSLAPVRPGDPLGS